MIPLRVEVLLVWVIVGERTSWADDKWVWGEKSRSRGRSGESAQRDHEQVSRESLEYDRQLQGIYSHERPAYNDNVSKQTIDILSNYESKTRPESDYRYEVYENSGLADTRPPPYRPVAFGSPNRPVVPLPSSNRPGVSLPSPNRPVAALASPSRPVPAASIFALPARPVPVVSRPSALPITLPSPAGSRPNPNFAGPQGAASSVGILTGPVPSWENAQSTHKNGDPTQFERCKCSFSFNCKAPGIQFGNCDVGKQYCCYNSKGGGSSTHAGFGSHLDVDRTDGSNGQLPAILAGPGGPVDNYNLDAPGPDASVDYPGAGPGPFTKRPNPLRPPPPNRGPPPPPFGAGPPPPIPPSPFGGRPSLPPPPPPPNAPEPFFRPYTGPPVPPGPPLPPLPFYDYVSRTSNVTKIVSENASNSEDP
ncbi:uncharacterized protein [Bemisia tabaci]|uniref:uncharacterized protein n=1 Tax=Bemisia tabaci TaxID=7038 RepID=UPI003B27D451